MVPLAAGRWSRWAVLVPLVFGCRREPASEDAPALVQHEVPFTLAWDADAQISMGEVVDLDLPADVVSFAATVDMPGVETGFGLVRFAGTTWVDGTLYEGDGAWYTPPYYHWTAIGGTIVAPITPDTSPEGATRLSLQAATLDDWTGETGTLHVRIRTGADPAGRIDMNVALVGDTTIDAALLDAALLKCGEIWAGGGGPDLGEVNVVPIPGEPFLRYRDSEELRATVIDADRPRAVNLFLIQDYLIADGTLGEAGGIPGPLAVQGVDNAGVIVSVDAHLFADGTLDWQLMGGTIAHEVGHQVGLFHTTEDDGTRLETLDDTADCPAEADVDGDGCYTAEECEQWDGPNFMFWASGDFVQEEISAAQAFVLDASVVAR